MQWEQTPPSIKVAPSQLVEGFESCSLRADEVLRMLTILASRQPPVFQKARTCRERAVEEER